MSKKIRPAAASEFRKTTIALAVAAFAGAVGLSAAAPGDPVTGEIPVNTFTSLSQAFGAVAMDADGDFVVVWNSNGQDGSDYGVIARRFAVDGTPASPEIQVNTVTTGAQSLPAVAMDADGDFVVAWQSNGQDGGGYGIIARRFAADGTPASLEIPVNTFTTNGQRNPAVAMDADGNFVVSWNSNAQDGDSDGVFARSFAANGTATSAEIPVNTTISNIQNNSTVALDADGDFVVAWQSLGQDGDAYGIFARRFAASGAPVSDEIPVNGITTGDQRFAAVALDADGDFVVAWQNTDQDGDSTGTFARRFAADGTPASAEIPVNTFTANSQGVPAAAMDADGDFVVTWESLGQDGSGLGVFARRFAADGTPVSAEIPINLTTSNTQRFPAVAMDADGDFVVAWQSFPQDGNHYGVFARRFEGGLACTLTPRTCTDLPAGSLSFKNSDKPGKDSFKYKAGKGDTTGVPELFGDPTVTTENALCIYNANGLVLQLGADPAEINSKGQPAWKINSKGATKFGNSAGNSGGVTKIQQKPGDKAKVTWAAGKETFVIPALPLADFPIVVQNQISGGACVETSFEEADFSKNDAEKVKAKGE